MIYWSQRSICQPIATNRKRNFKCADWPKYTALLEKSLPSIDTTTPLKYSEFNFNSAAADATIPYNSSSNTPTCSKHPYVNWWTEEGTQAVKNRKKATREVLKNGNTIAAYQQQLLATQTIIRNAKKEVWRKYTQSFNATTPTKIIWDQVKAFQKGKTDSKLNPNDP
jgi:transposase